MTASNGQFSQTFHTVTIPGSASSSQWFQRLILVVDIVTTRLNWQRSQCSENLVFTVFINRFSYTKGNSSSRINLFHDILYD